MSITEEVPIFYSCNVFIAELTFYKKNNGPFVFKNAFSYLKKNKKPKRGPFWKTEIFQKNDAQFPLGNTNYELLGK